MIKIEFRSSFLQYNLNYIMEDHKFVPLNNEKIAVVELLKDSKMECETDVACQETAKYKINSCFVLHILSGSSTSSKGTYVNNGDSKKFVSGKKIVSRATDIVCFKSIDPAISFGKETLSDGILKKYDSSGNIKSETTFEKYVKNGPENIYIDGKIARATIYSAGKKTGQETDFYLNESHSIHVVRNYNNGYLNGIQQRYHPNGQIHVLGSYKNGSKSGKFELTNENGEIVATVEHKGGYAAGEFIIYEKGVEKYIAEFYFGRPDGGWSELTYYKSLPGKLQKGVDYDKVVNIEEGGVCAVKLVNNVKYKDILTKFEFDAARE